DVVVRLRWPFDYDTIPGLVLEARYDSLPNSFGTRSVGRWLPWEGRVLDAATDAPVPGAHVEFRRAAGIALAPEVYSTTTDTSGRFRVRSLPLRDGEVVGALTATF